MAKDELTTAVSDEHSGTMVSDPGTYTSPVTSEMTTEQRTKSTMVEPTVTPEVATPPVTATTPDAPVVQISRIRSRGKSLRRR